MKTWSRLRNLTCFWQMQAKSYLCLRHQQPDVRESRRVSPTCEQGIGDPIRKRSNVAVALINQFLVLSDGGANEIVPKFEQQRNGKLQSCGGIRIHPKPGPAPSGQIRAGKLEVVEFEAAIYLATGGITASLRSSNFLPGPFAVSPLRHATTPSSSVPISGTFPFHLTG